MSNEIEKILAKQYRYLHGDTVMLDWDGPSTAEVVEILPSGQVILQRQNAEGEWESTMVHDEEIYSRGSK